MGISDIYTNNEVYEVEIKFENRVKTNKLFKLFERNDDERTITNDQSRTD